MANYQKEDKEVANIAAVQNQDYNDNVAPAEARFMTERGKQTGELYYFGVSSEDKPTLLKDARGARVSYIAPGDSHIIVVTDEGGGRLKKIKNKFVWSSRTERGLHIVLNLWNEILEKLPDATLDICSYGKFPKDKEDENMN